MSKTVNLRCIIKGDNGPLTGLVKDGVMHFENNPDTANTYKLVTQVMLQKFPSQRMEHGTIDIHACVGTIPLFVFSFNARRIEIVAGDFSHLVTAEITPVHTRQNFFDLDFGSQHVS